MSRFVEVLNEFGPELHVDNIPKLLEDLVMRLDSKNAHIDFEFPFFLEKLAPVTRAAGMMDYSVRFAATIEGGKVDFAVSGHRSSHNALPVLEGNFRSRCPQSALAR
jgi:GTP cyclohydrolase I